MIRVVHPGSRIRMLTFSHPGSRVQGSKRHPIPDPGSGSATLVGSYRIFLYVLLCFLGRKLGVERKRPNFSMLQICPVSIKPFSKNKCEIEEIFWSFFATSNNSIPQFFILSFYLTSIWPRIFAALWRTGNFYHKYCFFTWKNDYTIAVDNL